jgi:SAM-dependent methyltransferase
MTVEGEPGLHQDAARGSAARAADFDTSVPHVARVYDYWLGGKDNFPADREAGEQALTAFPETAFSVRANRAFLARVVSFLVAEMGIRQFLDIGTGIPASNNTHEVAQSIARESRIVYVDNDPIVLSHARALLASKPEGACDYIDGDLRNTADILAEAAKTLDFSEPVAVMLIAIMHCVQDSEDPYGVVSQLLDAVPPGSFLALSHPGRDIGGSGHSEMHRRLNKLFREPITARTQEEITRFFDGTELLEPGVVLVSQWRPESEIQAKTPTGLWGGLGRKSASPS